MTDDSARGDGLTVATLDAITESHAQYARYVTELLTRWHLHYRDGKEPPDFETVAFLADPGAAVADRLSRAVPPSGNVERCSCEESLRLREALGHVQDHLHDLGADDEVDGMMNGDAGAAWLLEEVRCALAGQPTPPMLDDEGAVPPSREKP